MLNYIKGEIYRLFHKKSMYIFFAVLAALYVLFTAIDFSQEYTAETMVRHAGMFFPLLPVFIGGYLFATFYTDDLSSKNLATLIGFGMEKIKIVLSKFLLMTLLGVVIFGLIPLFMVALFALLGISPTAGVLGVVYAHVLTGLLRTIAFAALSGIVVYGLQRGTFAMVLYVLLALGFISQLVGLILGSAIVRGFIPGLEDHLMLGITDRIQEALLSGGPVIPVLVEYVVYVAIALTLSIFAFHKKELEF